ncbi:unnamed protein product [Paramecium sonneborni]|uniref:Uncharacterized protein n=1 Tax=Paramecium sonneborni TaxID=65129 RepID=A0A8S1PBE9_9CILI|nr:unnamed protein product [Paramecium sonneborni]
MSYQNKHNDVVFAYAEIIYANQNQLNILTLKNWVLFIDLISYQNTQFCNCKTNYNSMPK